MFQRATYFPRGTGVDAEGAPIIPIPIGGNAPAVLVARAMHAAGFDVRAIRPPTVPVGTARLRVSVNVGLSDEVLDEFSVALANALREVGLCSEESS